MSTAVTAVSRRGDPRLARAGRVAIAIVAVVLAASAAQTAYRLGQPTDGWSFTLVGTMREEFVLGRYSGTGPTPLRAGDELVAVDGRPIRDWFEAAIGGTAQPPPGWRPGGTVTYDVIREGRRIEVEVRPYVRGDEQKIADLLRRQLQFPGGLFMLALGAFVLSRRPDSAPAALLLLVGGLLTANVSLSESISEAAGGVSEIVSPSSFWLAQAFNNQIWTFGILPAMVHLFLVFPTPVRLLARHPGLVAAGLYGFMPAATVAAFALAGADLVATHRANFNVGLAWSLFLVALIPLIAVRRLVSIREPVARAQIRWIAWSLVVWAVAAFALFVLQSFDIIGDQPMLVASSIVMAVLPITFAIAILRYRLFDIDLVINRSLVFGGLTALIVVLYVATVGALGTLLSERSTAVVALVGTGIVAVVVQPLRERLQRGVNRLMYGERDDPYAVVSRLGKRLEAVVRPDAVLPVVAETVMAALKLPHVAVELWQAGREIRVAEVGTAPDGEPMRVPIAAAGEFIGWLVLGPRAPHEPLSRDDRALLEVLARQAGVAIRSARLAADLQASRERIVAAREEERRRLRRDLHDGLGPVLAATALKLDAVVNLSERGSPGAGALLDAAIEDVRRALDDIRRLVDDLRPPALDERGLAGAIREQARAVGLADVPGQPLAIIVDAPPELPPLAAAVEVAAYRIAVEAVTNAARHSRARRCRVGLELISEGESAAPATALGVTIEDDGVGLPDRYRPGVGLLSMRERATELGGALVVARSPLGGTRVFASLPLGTR